MARLNEPPAAPATVVTSTAAAIACQPITTETLDAQKRRFLRQNRELAKHNSSQSLRIRTLELDVSRLLAENLELRNQVLHLQNEVYTAQSQASTAAVLKVKNDLQAKIAELSGLVDGMEEIQKDERSLVTTRKPLEGNWRERQTLSELMRESQMPTITEDRQYPQRTLNADEIRAIRLSDQSSNESPDLGPPPIARFDYIVDPVKNGSPLINKVLPDVLSNEAENESAAQLSINLETRRKRKDGQPKLEIRRHSNLPQSPGTEGETSSMLRTGAKRKLADRETDKPIKPPSKGDFTFSRKVETKAETGSDKSKAIVKVEEVNPPSPKPARKILGDKSVNQSPRKTTTTSNKPETEKAKPAADSKDSTSTRRRRISSIPLPSPGDAIIETVEIAPPPTEIQPKTPAALDLFSPTPSEPSTLKEAGRGDTPPPSDLSSLSIASDGGMRPSRRARSAVNYAEPSLISKMRRPDKKMVDAVTGLQDPRRAMSGSQGRSSASTATVIKKESVEDEVERWKSTIADVVASSPLTQKSGSEDPLPTLPAMTEKPSNSSTTISALMLASRKRRESSGQNSLPPLGTDIDAAAKKLEELDLYEFRESSSPVAGESSALVAPAKVNEHRRHSSVPKDVRVLETGLGKGEGESRGERVANRRRRSMML